MGLKIFLISIKIVIVTCIFGLVLSGCTPAVMKPSPPDVYRETPREADDQPDDAIGILERSLNLNPDNGRNYYYLAEAWLMKWNIGQATEFNRLAEIYLKDDSEWLNRVKLQRERIKEREQ
jgi:cytochrome c-type biogenesis protein CcmH/NrfG